MRSRTYPWNGERSKPLKKPKLVFFQYRYDPALPSFLLQHAREHVACLSEFFDVTVIDTDCDYSRVCDKYEPDMTLFESGVNHETCRRLRITHTNYSPRTPKVGLQHGDGFCNARAGFLSDMEHWGIETFFSIAVTAGEHTPAIADKLFVWPVFIDPAVHRDYGMRRSIPVLFTGARNQFYPWRQDLLAVLGEHYPVMLCPHPGYAPNPAVARVLVGDEYARTLNASWFVPACGTLAKEVVRKHFEVPACNACLVTERSPGLEAAGFVDMQNCVFADRSDVLDKLSWLFAHPENLDAVIKQGHELAHSRHTLYQRDQLLQWFLLTKQLGPHERIIQPGPFSQLSVVSRRSGQQTIHLRSGGRHLAFLRKGDEKLARGHYREAERDYLHCVSYLPWMPEPKLKLAQCALYLGQPQLALSYLEQPLDFILNSYKARDPDPVEWAHLILVRLCLGDLPGARQASASFPWLCHPELDRTRLAVSVIAGGSLTRCEGVPSRTSLHQLPSRSLDQWIDEACKMLSACGRDDHARRLRHSVLVLGNATDDTNNILVPSALATAAGTYITRRPNRVRVWARRVRRDLTLQVRRRLAAVLHRLEAKYGYFLPYRWSSSREEHVFQMLQKLARGQNIQNVLALGLASGATSTAALLAGLLENENAPTVFCLTDTRRWPGCGERRDEPAIRWYQMAPVGSDPGRRLVEAIAAIRQDANPKQFSLIFVAGSGVLRELDLLPLLSSDLAGAHVVVLEDLGARCTYDLGRHLAANGDYRLIAHNPGLGPGYSIFLRRPQHTLNVH